MYDDQDGAGREHEAWYEGKLVGERNAKLIVRWSDKDRVSFFFSTSRPTTGHPTKASGWGGCTLGLYRHAFPLAEREDKAKKFARRMEQADAGLMDRPAAARVTMTGPTRREVNGRPVWRHAAGVDRYLAFDSTFKEESVHRGDVRGRPCRGASTTVYWLERTQAGVRFVHRSSSPYLLRPRLPQMARAA